MKITFKQIKSWNYQLFKWLCVGLLLVYLPSCRGMRRITRTTVTSIDTVFYTKFDTAIKIREVTLNELQHDTIFIENEVIKQRIYYDTSLHTVKIEYKALNSPIPVKLTKTVIDRIPVVKKPRFDFWDGLASGVLLTVLTIIIFYIKFNNKSKHTE